MCNKTKDTKKWYKNVIMFLLFKLHNRVQVPNACWWKMIEGGWSSSLWKCVKIFSEILKKKKKNVKFSFWKLIKYLIMDCQIDQGITKLAYCTLPSILKKT
jgi:hypothetical protein